MSNVEDRKNEQWHERLALACTYSGISVQHEHEHFRKEAAAAPLEALELFLSSQVGMYEADARAVMAQVYDNRLNELEEERAHKEGRLAWLRGLAQQVSSQVISTLIIGIVVGFISGVWFCTS